MLIILKYNICGHGIPIAPCTRIPDETNRSIWVRRVESMMRKRTQNSIRMIHISSAIHVFQQRVVHYDNLKM
jgi:hypothetical protein